MSARTSRPPVALNPLSWYLTEHGFDPGQAPELPEILRQVREAGFLAVHADPPDTMSVAAYRQLLADSGLEPAPGYFQARFEDSAAAGAFVDQARRAAAQHAELGLDRIFLAAQFGDEARMAAPGLGTGHDERRFGELVANLSRTAQAMAFEGVIPCLHQHVGTLIETPAETEQVLARTDPSFLLLGPDTGHLAWAGTDPVGFIRKHLARVGAVHLKDVHLQVAAEGRARGDDYWAITARHLWTEPGRGDLDLSGVLEVLQDFGGWLVVEVDLPDQNTPLQSAAVSARWVDKFAERSTGGGAGHEARAGQAGP